jgi:Baseplate J-like protein
VIFACCDENRKAAVLGNPALNGIDYLEVLDHDAPAGSPRQQTLFIHCLKTAPANVVPANVLIEGGERVTSVTTLWVAPALAPPPQALPDEVAYFAALENAATVLVVRTSVYGDFSPYTLRLVNDATQAAADTFDLTEALAGFDPQLAEVTFSFKVECGPEFDCEPAAPDCPPNLPAPPPINYLAKDFGSFRTVILDRLNQLLPAWQGSSEADIGVALAELIAYAGDQLSYHQDAVTTEAYLLTARSRISLRRHALLVDYRVHDGCNARAWIQLDVAVPVFLDRTVTRFYSYAPGMPSSLAVGAGNETAALDAGAIVFEPMHDADLFPEHNLLQFYTWGDTGCCLPQGATEATLLGTYPNLQPSDVLIFQEVLGPQTGVAADADLRHRCAVRLTSVTTKNGQGQLLVDPLFESGTGAPIVSASQQPTPVTEIQWSAEDALPFALCLSSTFLNSSGVEQTLTGVSVARGNVVLADHGLSMPGTSLPVVPAPTLMRAPSTSDRCDPAPPAPFPVRYRPQLPEGPVTQAAALALAGSPVTASAVPLLANGFVSLTDENGFTSLMIAADAPASWPQYFGVFAVQSIVDSSNFDLSIVFDPPGGAAGMTGRVVLEQFPNLTLTPDVANSAVLQLNSLSRFVNVPASYVPGANPTTFPAAPTMLIDSGVVELEDTHGTPYLTLQPANPLSWPPLFAVLAQGYLATPDVFNLLLIYQPSSGGVGVALPVVVEQFPSLSLDTVSDAFDSASDLLNVLSFEEMPNASLSACALMQSDAGTAVPAISLAGVLNDVTTTWNAVPDLLAAGPEDRNFVVEIETDGTAYLRFGDGVNGLAPEAATAFTASYRVGNGSAGNVGAESLVYFAGDPRIVACTNPIAASGGVDPETNAQIQRRAPQAFMTQERAVNMADYVTVTEAASPLIEDAAATLRWTGSWYTAFIAAEPESGTGLSPALARTLRTYVDRYRLAGQDVKLEGADYVPLQIDLTICVDPAYFQSDVEQMVRKVLGALFAPGRFQLGQTVYLSPIYAAARSVAGVLTVAATIFQPQGGATVSYVQMGEIPMGPFQVARLDNDPSFPNHGRLTLTMAGGK